MGGTKINMGPHLPMTRILSRFKSVSENSEGVIGISAIVKRDRPLNMLSLETCPFCIKSCFTWKYQLKTLGCSFRTLISI